MNFTATQKAWILLISLVIGTACAVFTTSYLGGAKWWVAVIVAIGTAGTNVYHALSKGPQDVDPGSKPPAT